MLAEEQVENKRASGSGTVEVFDPPYCCSTGLCGPTLDQTLVDVNEALLSLQARGVHVERYQMASSPGAFTGNAEVMRLVRERQLAALPITMVNRKMLRSGAYLRLDEIEAALNGAD